MSLTPQSLPIPQIQGPSAASSSSCPANAEGQRSHSDSASLACATTLRRGISNRVPLCLGYSVHRSLPPTRRSSSDESVVPGEAQDKPLSPHANLSLLKATRIASRGIHLPLERCRSPVREKTVESLLGGEIRSRPGSKVFGALTSMFPLVR